MYRVKLLYQENQPRCKIPYPFPFDNFLFVDFVIYLKYFIPAQCLDSLINPLSFENGGSWLQDGLTELIWKTDKHAEGWLRSY